ncbi:hypothetical protein [Actinoallomurus sp. NPDC050550]|uniref:hypothetical protein n=1 Tax=Actinoallomurus sp. NPDC050550 TaxID=3154937 RepID=UPI0033E582E9
MDPLNVSRVPLPLARVLCRDFPLGRAYEPALQRFLADVAALSGPPDHTQPSGSPDRAPSPGPPDRAPSPGPPDRAPSPGSPDRAPSSGPPDRDWLPERRTTFTDMAAGMLDELRGDGAPIGLVVLAHGTPDSEPGWPACFLTWRLPGAPPAFAVADQGVVTPFTALRVAGARIRADGPRRAIVLIMDQRTLVPPPRPAGAADARIPLRNRAVALVLDERGTLGTLTAGVEPGVGPKRAGGFLAGLAETGQPVLTGPALASWDGPPNRVRASVGAPCTGLWALAAEGLDRWRAAGVRRVHLLDHDPELRCLGHCAVDLVPPPLLP